MITITNGKKTINVPDATAADTLKQKWLKDWKQVDTAGVPQEVIQFQAKLKDAETPKPEPKTETDLFKLSLHSLEEIVDTLTEDQLKGLIQDPRKSVKALVKRQLNKVRNVSGK
jgi:hypothetical protein